MKMTQSPPGNGRRQRGVALVIVLSFVVLLTVAVVAYFTRTLNNRQLANDSYNGGKTEQLARSALDQIVSDFKQEIATGSTVTYLNGSTSIPTPPIPPAYVPTSRANMVPQRSGTSNSIPNLIRRSVSNDPMASPGVGSRASAVNSVTDAAGNGRIVSLARWNQHYLIPQADPAGSKPDPIAAFTAPDWVMMTKEKGPVVLSTPTSDVNGSAITPIGRYAYAVYDEGGLLDANLAGFPTGAVFSQYGTKGLLASADLTQLPVRANASAYPADYLPQINAIDQLIGWRNFATAQPGGSFGSFSFDSESAKRYYNALAASSSSSLQVSPSVYLNRTDQMFLSRGQLITFQRSIQQKLPGSFPACALQYMGTFTRELNAPSWGPAKNASDMGGNSNNMTTVTPNAVNPPSTSVAYYDNRNSDASVNRFLPGVRFTKAGTVTGYDANAKPYQYKVKIGDLLVQRRFPLNRLAWIGPHGARNGGTAESIQACFGLVWGPANETKLKAQGGVNGVNVWKYCGPTGTTEQGVPATLAQVAAENREPNFFELLQAGVLSGSLALLPSELNNYTPTFTLDSDQWPELQLFRIGATMITQSQQPDSAITANYPTTIEFAHNGLPFVVAGVDDLPYLNTFYTISGSPSLTKKTPLEVYMVYGLWNPHQSVGIVARPNVRLVLEGSVTMMNQYGDTRDTTPGHYTNASVTVYNFSSPGYAYNLNSATSPILLTNTTGSATGVNGFADPHILTAQDVQSSLGATSAGFTWGTTPSIGGNTYVGYRLPDFLIDLTKNPGPKDANYRANTLAWSCMYFYFNTAANAPFNAWLEFQNPDGFWIPYNYFAGVNHIDRGIAKTPGYWSSYMGPDNMGPVLDNGYATGTTAQPLPIDDPGNTNLYCLKYPLTNSDPRSARFNYAITQTPNSRPGGFNFFTSSIWSNQTENITMANPWGRKVTQWGTAVPLGAAYSGSGLSRNNSTAPNTYKDPDGVQRIADSGLYTDNAFANGWQGDPYALASTVNIDRPVVFHRPYTNVAELGYIPRDYPWRTLDFFTAQSADAGLLDLFTASSNTGLLSAGRVNLNTRNTPVLTALLGRAGTNFVTTATPTTLTKPAAIAAKLIALTSTASTTDGPLLDKSEIVSRFVGQKLSTAPITATSDFKTLDEQNIKTRREAVTRSLAEIGQTRTWNLLVDVVAQSGRYPISATKLTQFNVEGERHFWLHVAVDRFTGEVIDQQLEPAPE